MATTETDPVMTKFAAALAEMAVTGSNTAFVKLAAAEKLSLPVPAPATKQANTTDVLNYLKSVDPRILYGLGGLGAGGLVGLLQGKNKKRNALWYGLLGGLGGLGLGTALSTTKPGFGQPGGLPDSDKPYDLNNDGTLNANELRLAGPQRLSKASPHAQEALRNLGPSTGAHVTAGALGVGAAVGTGKAQSAGAELIRRGMAKVPAPKWRPGRLSGAPALPKTKTPDVPMPRALSTTSPGGWLGRLARILAAAPPVATGAATYLATKDKVPDQWTIRRNMPEFTSGAADTPPPQADTGLPF